MFEVSSFWSWAKVAVAVVAVAVAGAIVFAGPASAADGTAWLCKPGQADNPCLGKMDGSAIQPNGAPATELGYTAASDPPVDCFYVYPTQSNQSTANADLNPDQELKDVAVNQARQFSRVCDVYAPLYRQYTFKQPITPEVRDIAYSGVLNAWNDYLANYNHGRGVIIIGHSQGSSHLARMINEQVDQNPEVRDRVISSILPGALVYVPKGEKVGGQFQNIPACETGDQLNCVIAYSSFTGEPGPNTTFSRIANGYWINPNPRPDPAKYEVLCVNPTEVSGDHGVLRPLANLSVFLGNPESAKPWLALPEYYNAACESAGDADWLNVSKIDPADKRPDLADLISNNGDLHLGDINLALDNLVSIAGTESEAYLAREAARERRPGVAGKLVKAKSKLKKSKSQLRNFSKKLKKANKKCKSAKRSRVKVRSRCAPKKKLSRKVKTAKRRSKSLNGQIRTLTAELKEIDQLG